MILQNKLALVSTAHAQRKIQADSAKQEGRLFLQFNDVEKSHQLKIYDSKSFENHLLCLRLIQSYVNY